MIGFDTQIIPENLPTFSLISSNFATLSNGLFEGCKPADQSRQVRRLQQGCGQSLIKAYHDSVAEQCQDEDNSSLKHAFTNVVIICEEMDEI